MHSTGAQEEFSTRLPEPHSAVLDAVFYRLSEKESRKEYPLAQTLANLADTEDCIVDVACGFGTFSYRLSQATTKLVVGIDIDDKAIARAQSLYQRDNLTFWVGDVSHLSRVVSGAGLLVVIQSLHHFDDLDSALDQMTATLSENGTLFIQDFDRMLVPDCVHLTGLSPKSRQEIRSALKSGATADLGRALRKRNLLNEPLVLTYLSFLAAYSASDVKARLISRGFSVVTGRDEPKATFALFAGKNTSQLALTVKARSLAAAKGI